MRILSNSTSVATLGGALAASLAVVALLFAAFAVTAQAAPNYLVDPVLSLTGGCSVSEIDNVPDPGCPAGPNPPAPFERPQAVTTDPHGDIYVASYGADEEGSEGRIDVFSASGHFITEVAAESPDKEELRSVAVDSKGYLYAYDANGRGDVWRYKPEPYEPEADPPRIAYPDPPELVADEVFAPNAALAVDPADDHLFIDYSFRVEERGSAEEGNPVVSEAVVSSLDGFRGVGMAVDRAHNRLYVSDQGATGPAFVKAFELEAPHNLVLTNDGSGAPVGHWTMPAVAVDEGTGDFFVYDGGQFASEAIYEFNSSGEYLQKISYAGIENKGLPMKLAVDNGAESPNGAGRSDGRYLYLPSGQAGTGHSFAFASSAICAPEVKGVEASGVGDTDAELAATVNPCGDPTSWTLEYTTRQHFETAGFEGAFTASSGTLEASKADRRVSGLATGLTPGTAYRFRVVAGNSIASGIEAEGTFATYPARAPSALCPNEALRPGPSALLPDCRAYELVTPSDTNGHAPFGLASLGVYFPTRQSSPDGNRVSFEIAGGTIPGFQGTGSLAGDPYLSTRTPQGWQTQAAGPNGSEAATVTPGSPSLDQGYSFWRAEGTGSALVEGKRTSYLRRPDGRSEVLGVGSLGTDLEATGRLIAPDGAHVLFTSGSTGASAVRLQPDAPPSGTAAIYDRTPDGVLHVVSLLPGDVTPAAGEDATYLGASLDGRGIAFSIGSRLYLRLDDAVTYEVGEGVAFEGVSEGAGRIFYLLAGDLRAFDVSSGRTIDFSHSGDVIPVNVATGGGVAFFLSPSVLPSPAGPAVGPGGSTPVEGEENLYRSAEGEISFLGTVSQRDIEGEGSGLGMWGAAVRSGQPAIDASRTTPDGQALLFESRAELTGYDSTGHVEIYRYDAVEGSLACLSCSPTGMPPTGDASLQSIGLVLAAPEPLNASDMAGNLRAGGARDFFQSPDPLVLADTDGLQDVYEWEADGVGSCGTPGGCVYLISSGRSARPNYLFATSDTGDDVFISTSDLLVAAQDPDETPSIYDARAEGGFPAPQGASECQGEACQPAVQVPARPSVRLIGGGNVGRKKSKKRRCPRDSRGRARREKRRDMRVRKRAVPNRVVRRRGRGVCRKHRRRRHHHKHRNVPHTRRKVR